MAGAVPALEMTMYDTDLSLADQEPIDYTEQYNRAYGTGALAVHACGCEMLVLRKLPAPLEVATVRGGRKRKVNCDFALESYSLSRVARDGTDDFACVEWGPDTEYFSKAQARHLLRQASTPNGSLFKEVNLF